MYLNFKNTIYTGCGKIFGTSEFLYQNKFLLLTPLNMIYAHLILSEQEYINKTKIIHRVRKFFDTLYTFMKFHFPYYGFVFDATFPRLDTEWECFFACDNFHEIFFSRCGHCEQGHSNDYADRKCFVAGATRFCCRVHRRILNLHLSSVNEKMWSLLFFVCLNIFHLFTNFYHMKFINHVKSYFYNYYIMTIII